MEPLSLGFDGLARVFALRFSIGGKTGIGSRIVVSRQRGWSSQCSDISKDGLNAASVSFCICISALILVAAPSPVFAASPSTELKKMMSKIDQQLCRSLSLDACKRRTGQKKTKLKSGKPGGAAKSKLPKAKPVKLKPATGVAAKDEKSTDPKTVEEPKLSSGKDIPVPQTPEKGRIPIPVLKPASFLTT